MLVYLSILWPWLAVVLLFSFSYYGVAMLVYRFGFVVLWSCYLVWFSVCCCLSWKSMLV